MITFESLAEAAAAKSPEVDADLVEFARAHESVVEAAIRIAAHLTTDHTLSTYGPEVIAKNSIFVAEALHAALKIREHKIATHFKTTHNL